MFWIWFFCSAKKRSCTTEVMKRCFLIVWDSRLQISNVHYLLHFFYFFIMNKLIKKKFQYFSILFYLFIVIVIIIIIKLLLLLIFCVFIYIYIYIHSPSVCLDLDIFDLILYISTFPRDVCYQFLFF